MGNEGLKEYEKLSHCGHLGELWISLCTSERQGKKYSQWSKNSSIGEAWILL